MLGLRMIHDMEKLQREMNQLFSGFGFDSGAPFGAGDFRVEDSGEALRISGALPGVNMDKLDVSLLGRRLSLSYDETAEASGQEIVWHRRERRHGRFSRTFLLPHEVDAERIFAAYENGILTITLPKAASALPKKIKVNAA